MFPKVFDAFLKFIYYAAGIAVVLEAAILIRLLYLDALHDSLGAGYFVMVFLAFLLTVISWILCRWGIRKRQKNRSSVPDNRLRND